MRMECCRFLHVRSTTDSVFLEESLTNGTGGSIGSVQCHIDLDLVEVCVIWIRRGDFIHIVSLVDSSQ